MTDLVRLRRLAGMLCEAPFGNSITLSLTADELRNLYHLLAEEAMRMDDDGNEGAFDASPLKPIYDKIRNLVR